MKTIVLTLLAMLLYLAIPSSAQTLPCYDSSSLPIDTLRVETILQGEQGRVSKIVHDVIVERVTPTDQINYRIELPSIRFSGDAEPINETSTVAMFNAMAYATVSTGISAGYTLCVSSCIRPAKTRVAVASCVNRNNSGLTTSFVACGIVGCCARNYLVCCPNGPGLPNITLDSSYTAPCQGNDCWSTCP